MIELKQILTALALLGTFTAGAQDGIYGAMKEFQAPEDSTRTKVWWFHGETETTREGITADLEAFKEAGVGGVVYYDQVHGKAENAFDAFSPQWWEMLRFSASEADRLGLSFEITVSNGFVAGGPWITPENSMQRLCSSEIHVKGGQTIEALLPTPGSRWIEDVAILAFPMKKTLWEEKEFSASLEIEGPFTARSITYTAPKGRKSRVGAMQIPDKPAEEFSGMMYVAPEAAGVLECSDDGVNFREICTLPTCGGTSGLAQKTISFEPVSARHFRIRSNNKFSEARLSARAQTDRWQEKASYFSEFIEGNSTPDYKEGVIDPSSIIRLDSLLSEDGILRWDAPEGEWVVMRIGRESTGGKIKHGRQNLMGLECDKMSREAVRLQWDSYAGRIIDTLSTMGLKPKGVVMDSHEAGNQNWTSGFEKIFEDLNGYSLIAFLPATRGYIVGNKEETEKFLKDFRLSIVECITSRYYGEFNSLCEKAGVEFTAQATGNGLNLSSNNIQTKREIGKPQGEFWARDIHGSFDIVDCASASHLYGRRIASAEAFTDAKYCDSPATLKMLADFAYSKLINEFVVCASAYQPRLDQIPGNVANGRQYCLNRNNPFWSHSRPFWDYQARCAGMLRKGEAIVDILVYMGDDAPIKTLSYLLPRIPEGYNFDTATADALEGARVEKGELICAGGMRYRMLAIQRNVILDEEKVLFDEWKKHGLPIVQISSLDEELRPDFAPDMKFRSAARMDDCLRFSHRRLSDADVYFVYNHSRKAFSDMVELRTPYSHIYAFDPVDGSVSKLSDKASVRLELAADQSMFLVATSAILPHEAGIRSDRRIRLDGAWKIQFDPKMGGPEKIVKTRELKDWTAFEDEAIKYYSGMAVYSNSFIWDGKDADKKLFLHFDNLNWTAKVKINGQDAGIVWCAPWEIEVGHLLRKGRNEVEIEVCNSLYNRMIGDASKEEDEHITHSSHPLVSSDSPLIPSGIYGFVEIR